MKYLWIFSIAVALLFSQIIIGFSDVQAQPKLTDAEKAREYVGSSQCKMCHTNTKEYEKAAMTREIDHSKSMQSLMSPKAKEIAKERGLTVPPNEAPECLQCHVTGYNVETKSHPSKINPSDGLQCESCHGPGSDHVVDGKTLKFKPEEIANIDIHANISRPSEDRCRECHNEGSPTWDPERYTLADGTKSGFDFDHFYEMIKHENPANYYEDKYKGAYPEK